MRLAANLLFAVTLAFAMPASGASAEPLRIRLAHVLADTHSWNIAALGFSEDVAAETQGRVQVEIFPFGQLGSERDIVEGMQIGTIQAGIVGSGSFQSVEPRMGLVELPYAWPSRQAAFDALDGDLGQALDAMMLERGIVVLAWWENGYRHVTTRDTPIRSPADLLGLRIRVTPDKVRLDTFRALGAEPAPLAFNELYSALQQGLFDGQENPLSVIESSSLFEVQHHLALTGHIWGAACLSISRATWDRIKPADQAVLRVAAARWRDAQRDMIARSEDATLKALAANGMMIEIVDTAPFRAATAPIWEDWLALYGPELVALLKRYRQ